jgi:hypothetical protein
VETTLSVAPLGPAACRQTLEGRVRVSLPRPLGRVVEAIVRDSVLKSYSKLPEVVARWEAARGGAAGGALLAGRPPLGLEVGWIREATQEGAESTSETLALAEGIEEATGCLRAAERAGGSGTAAAAAPPRAAAAALAALLPVRVHGRADSFDSMVSCGSDGSDAPAEAAARAPGSRGARRAWRRFDSDYGRWAPFWAGEEGECVKRRMLGMLCAFIGYVRVALSCRLRSVL